MDIEWTGGTGIVRLGDGINAFETSIRPTSCTRADVEAATPTPERSSPWAAARHYSNGYDFDFLGQLAGPTLVTFMGRTLGAWPGC